MKKHLHWWFTLLFVWALAYDLAVWGGAARLPDVGTKLQLSAQRQALLAHLYMAGGSVLDDAVPALDEWGTRHAETAFSQGFERINDEPEVAMDLIFSNTWNATHGWIKTLYWGPPLFGLIALVLWSRRPKKVSLMGRR